MHSRQVIVHLNATIWLGRVGWAGQGGLADRTRIGGAPTVSVRGDGGNRADSGAQKFLHGRFQREDVRILGAHVA